MSARELLVRSRSLLFESAIGVAQCVEWSSRSGDVRAEDFAPAFQIGFTYRGASVWRIENDTVVVDPNQVLFIKKGENLHLADLRSDGLAQLIITPAMPVLRALTAEATCEPGQHPLFIARSRHASLPLQCDCARFLHAIGGNGSCGDPEKNAALLSLMRHALALAAPTALPSPRIQLLIRRTKEFVNATPTARLDLSRIAAAIGVSAAYLTDVFRRIEGVPLQRYVTQLRLARALNDLPQTRDLTRLALDLGFSSHSHFTAVFRRAFGCTPSAFRRATVLEKSVEPARYGMQANSHLGSRESDDSPEGERRGWSEVHHVTTVSG